MISTFDERVTMPLVPSQTILVAGAAGAIGEGISLALATAGATVIAVDHDHEGLRRLQEEMASTSEANLHPVSCELSSSEELASLASTILSKWGGLDAIVVSLGGRWNEGSLTEVELLREWNQVASKTLHPQLNLVHHLVPGLRQAPDGRYLLIGGSTAEHPEPRAGLTSVAAAAQLMVARVLQAEEEGVSTAALLLSGPVRSRKLTGGAPHWMDAAGVGELCVQWFQPGAFPKGKVLRAVDREELSRLSEEGRS